MIEINFAREILAIVQAFLPKLFFKKEKFGYSSNI